MPKLHQRAAGIETKHRNPPSLRFLGNGAGRWTEGQSLGKGNQVLFQFDTKTEVRFDAVDEVVDQALGSAADYESGIFLPMLVDDVVDAALLRPSCFAAG